MDRSAEGILKYLVASLEYNLRELNDCGDAPFPLGEKYAYVECLEIIQYWEKANSLGLDYEIEKRFPLRPSNDGKK